MVRAMVVALGVACAVSDAWSGGYRAVPMPAARTAKACGDRLASNSYRCTVFPEAGDSFTDCLRFTTPGEVSDKFDLSPDQLADTLGCTCTAAGSAKAPKLNAGSSFQCTGGDFAFSGVVSKNGKKISKGFVGTSGGASFAFTCTLDPACTAP